MNSLNTLLYTLSRKDRHLLTEIAHWALKKVCWLCRYCKENVVKKEDFSLEYKKSANCWGNPWRRTFRNVECLLGVSDYFSETPEIFSETWDFFLETWDVFLESYGMVRKRSLKFVWGCTVGERRCVTNHEYCHSSSPQSRDRTRV